MPASPGMRAALDAAEAARGRTGSNPWVGAVVVREGEVVASGATETPPGRHAEAAALAIAGAAATGAVVYVTLEPCMPFEGKRTRPCAEAIAEAGVKRVVVALEDPDPNIAGRGAAWLRGQGIEVEVGDGAEEARRQLRPYLKHRMTGVPYVIAKFAASLDGRIATASGDSKWITGDCARERAHLERAKVSAILVGSGTVLADDPALTARPGGRLAEHTPVRVVADAMGRVPVEARLFREPGRVVVATTREAPAAWKREVAARGAQLVECERAGAGVNLDQLLHTLGQRGLITVWAEGGATLLGSLFDGGNVDEVYAFIAPLVLGGRGLQAVGGEGAADIAGAWRLREPVVELLQGDMLVRGYVGDWSP